MKTGISKLVMLLIRPDMKVKKSNKGYLLKKSESNFLLLVITSDGLRLQKQICVFSRHEFFDGKRGYGHSRFYFFNKERTHGELAGHCGNGNPEFLQMFNSEEHGEAVVTGKNNTLNRTHKSF